MPRLGLVVNPLAGIGGRVGLKGSDGAETVLRALALGAQAQASRRAAQALQALRNATRLAAQSSYTTRGDGLELLTFPAEMGEEAARLAGWPARVVGRIRPGATSAEDTHRAAQEMEALGVDLLLFAGGDGTARDICQAVANRLPVLGIPAGVKIHSAVYAVRPEAAG